MSQFRTFVLPSKSDVASESALNAFLRSHRIVSVAKTYDAGTWRFCVEWIDGAQGDTKRERVTRQAFASFLEMEQVSVLPVTRKTGEFYARVFSFLKSVGTPIPSNDIWIAAGVLETGAVLITADRHLLSLPLVMAKTF